MDFFIPNRPYSPIDAFNRQSLAQGSPTAAKSYGDANYNGHRLTLDWNEYRKFYVVEYFWAGRHVLDRGKFEHCLNTAIEEYDRGALGSSVFITLRCGDNDAWASCCNHDRLIPWSLERETLEYSKWYTWRHIAASEAAPDHTRPWVLKRVLDWDLMNRAENVKEYEAFCKEKHGRAWYS